MPLILAPSFDEHTRVQIEAHIDQVRARRMHAAVVYAEGMNIKLDHESGQIQKRIARHYAMLARDIARLDRLDDAIDERIATLTNLLNEHGLIQDMIVHEIK